MWNLNLFEETLVSHRGIKLRAGASLGPFLRARSNHYPVAQGTFRSPTTRQKKSLLYGQPPRSRGIRSGIAGKARERKREEFSRADHGSNWGTSGSASCLRRTPATILKTVSPQETNQASGLGQLSEVMGTWSSVQARDSHSLVHSIHFTHCGVKRTSSTLPASELVIGTFLWAYRTLKGVHMMPCGQVVALVLVFLLTSPVIWSI